MAIFIHKLFGDAVKICYLCGETYFITLINLMLMVKKIVLSIAAVLFACTSLFAQNKQVTGAVSGPDGSPIVGATVVVEGTTIGTSTDLQGKYVLSAPANGTLIVSFIGYEDAKVAIAGKTTVDVKMKEASKAIEDIIVVAFGETKKEAFTGSATVVSAEDLAKTQSSNVTDALVGKVAGMQTSSSSGRPGTGQSIAIRGIGSFNADNDPLWVVDGMPYEGDINNINPADIESISVLKDAASNALYGARGANGVIMVTTKRAKAGDARVVFEGKWGVNQRQLPSYDVASGVGEYYELYYGALARNYAELNPKATPAEVNAAANKWMLSSDTGGLGYDVMTYDGLLVGLNGKINPTATEGKLVTGPDGNKYWMQPANWMDALYRNSFRQEYNVSVSAAGEKTNFFASVGYLDNQGIIDGSSMDRISARLKADYQAKKWLKVGGNASYAHFNFRNGTSIDSADDGGEGSAGGTGNSLKAAYNPSIYPIYVLDGNKQHTYDQWGMVKYDTGNGENAGYKSPIKQPSHDLQDLQLDKQLSEGNAFSVNGFADFKLYRDLTVTINGGMNLDETRTTDVRNPYYGQFATEGGLISKGHSRLFSYNFQQLINYTHTFGTQHNLDVLLGHENYVRHSYSLAASKSGMFSADNDELYGAVVDKSSAYSAHSSYNNEGYFLRAQYNFDERVYVSASYRRDASSRFHPKHRWGNFWSAGAAWVMSKESWFKADCVDLFKVKASYGQQGNDSIDDYLYTDLYTIENNGSGGLTTIWGQKGNEELTWETNSNLNVGVEFSLWKGRLAGDINYFHRTTTDMLFFLPVPSSLGYSGYYTNIGDMLNQGIEIELNADLVRMKNFTWNVGLNMTHFQNKIVRLPEAYKNNTTHDGKLHGRQSGSRFFAEGESIYTFYIPTYAGVDKATGKSLWYTYDDNGKRVTTDDYTIADANGRELQGTATPDLYGGFNTVFSFYGVDISANFAYQIGGQALDQGYQLFTGSPYAASAGQPMHRDLKNAWTPENPNSNIPRLQYGDQYSSATSSRYLIDASYLNIQNITVGYTLPSKITRKFLVEKLRIYATADNVWLFSKRKGFDPRQAMGGITSGYGPYYYAPIRTISGGISITF